MMKTNTSQAGAFAVFKALGHPTRLEFVSMLRDRERCVCEFVEVVECGWSTVSKHLSVLKDAGIIEDEKRGLQVFYRLKLPCVGQFIDCLEKDENERDCSCIGQ